MEKSATQGVIRSAAILSERTTDNQTERIQALEHENLLLRSEEKLLRKLMENHEAINTSIAAFYA